MVSSLFNIILGAFEKGKLSGYGEKYCLNGNNYIGQFKNGLKDGVGIDENNEHFYEGEFREDKKEGKGKLKYKIIQDTYEGEFKDNAITGTGFYIWSNRDTYEGTFLNGKMEGRGKYKWPDGGEYEGDYRNNIKEGVGRFKWSNGKIFEGPFKNGKPHGVGKLIISNVSYEVEFKDGKLTHNSKEKGKSIGDQSTDIKL